MDILIVGCGGHGREVLAIIGAINEAAPSGPVWRVTGFVDDRPSELDRKRVQRLGVPYLGPLGVVAEAAPDTHLAVGIGDPRVRRHVVGRLAAWPRPAAVLIHPDATVGPEVVHGEGFVAFPGARVTTNVTFGRHVQLNQNVTVGHDCVFGDFVSVNPLAAVSGNCHLADGALVGAGAAVLQNLRVGADATVGAAACVVRDVPAGTVVKGIPAR